ncbi:MAG: TonB-dependent receptor [Ignavibacteriae bacterium]|nr:TonB-dependent receptor [Ignavibacteriota bacterium]
MYRIIILAMLIFVGTSNAEVLTGELKGKVYDTDNKPLKYVKVTLTEPGISVITDDKGEYSFKEIPYGLYNILISKTGYVSKNQLIEVKEALMNLNYQLESSLIETSIIDVTSSFEAQDISQSTFSLSTLNLKTLTQERSHNLSTTIENIPGVNSISTGIGIGKPVIRGLSSNSVLIVHDGVKHESQQWGDEHSPEVSLYDLDRIEILRGPASLLYGSEGIGGVVNIISKPLQFSGTGKNLIYGDVDLGGFSVNNEGTGNVMLGLGLKNVGFKGHLGYRKSGDVSTPDGTLLVNTLNPLIKDTINGGMLSNSGANEIEGGVSLGYRGSFGYLDAGFETFDREIQMHDADPLATGNQKLNTKQFELSGNFKLSKKYHLETILSYQIHGRKEFETIEDKDLNNPNLNWKLNTFQGDLRLHNDLNKYLSGTFGISLTNMVNQSLGIEKLIPNFNSTSFGIYGFEKYNMNKFTFSAGLRYDFKKDNIESTIMETDSVGNITKQINPRSIDFSAFSGSFGIVFRPNDMVDIFSNVGRGWRAPSEFELYVDGVHEGTNRVERGIITQNPDASPIPESSLNIDLGIRTRFKNINAEVSLFNNVVNDFIYPSPTNEVDPVSGLPIFNVKQDKSTFRGLEYSFQYQPVSYLLLSLNGDYVFTNNKANGSPLPFTPPMKNIIELRFQKQQIGDIYNPYFKLSAKIVSGQNNVDPFETTTDGYTIFNAGIGMDVIFAKTVASIDLSADNLADTKYVDHLSRFKSFAMNPGRSFNLKVTVPFQF